MARALAAGTVGAQAGNRIYLSGEERERSLEAPRREVQEKCR